MAKFFESPPQQDSEYITPTWRVWFSRLWLIVSSLTESGTTANRPVKDLFVGRRYFDTDLGMPVWLKSFTAGAGVWVNSLISFFPNVNAPVTTSDEELNFVAGVTSAIQTQIDTRATDSLVVHLAGTETITGLKNFTAASTAPTASPGTNTTQIASTGFVTTADNLKANLASPALTGTPTAPTAAPGTNTTQIATAAFATAADNLKANDSSVVHLAGAETVTGLKTFTSDVVIDGTPATIAMKGTGSARIELGRVDGSNSTPFIDFHSGATGNDYNSRIIASAGTAAVGDGTLSIIAGAIELAAANSVTAINPATGNRSTQVMTTQKLDDEFPAVLANPGTQTLSSGLILKWGSLTCSATPGAATAVTFNTAFPTNWLNVQVSGQTTSTSNAAAWFDTPTASGFNVRAALASQIVKWFAIGY